MFMFIIFSNTKKQFIILNNLASLLEFQMDYEGLIIFNDQNIC